MDPIAKQIARARRRLNLNQFLLISSWTVFGALLVAAIGYAARRYWGAAPTEELYFFLAGGVVSGLMIGGLAAYLTRRQTLEAAIEIDRRFQLKERVSSSLTLAPDEVGTEAGQALVSDTLRRVERIEVADKFQIQAGPQVALPLLAGLVFLLTLFVPNLSEEQAQAAAEREAAKAQIRKPAEDLRKKIAKREKEAVEKGLTDASDLLKKVNEELEDVAKGDVEKKEALLKINDIAKELDQRRKELGDSANMKKQLEGLKDIKSGPADKMFKAMEGGDFEAAMEAMQDLKDKVAQGELSEKEKQDLADQLQQMRDKLDQMQAEHEQKKRELQDQIQQRKDAGDLDAAESLQQQLDELNGRDGMMDKLQQMSDKLGQAADNLQAGEGDLAAENLDDLLDQLEMMQQELDELAELGELMDDLDGAKSRMQMGYGQGNMPGDGFGLGEGQGQGERPEEETDIGTFRSKVAGKLQKGAAVRTGTADGPNRKGRTREEMKEEIRMSISEGAEAIHDQQRLPRDQREHLREYFRQFNDE